MSSQLDIGERMTIGELATRTGIPAGKIRYYEKLGVAAVAADGLELPRI